MTDEKLKEAWKYAYRAGLKTQRVRDVQEAEDAAQESMVRLLQGKAGGKDSANPSWFAVVAHNYVLSQGRHRQVKMRKDRIFVGTQIAQPEHLEEERKRHGEWLAQHLIAALPEYYRPVAELILLERRTQAEAAKILGVPVGTVMSRLHRAREILKRVLRKERSA